LFDLSIDLFGRMVAYLHAHIHKCTACRNSFVTQYVETNTFFCCICC